jgi:calcium-dependent protein kinase
MAHELLTGRLPFNDKRNLYNPALSAVLRSILTDKLDFKKPCWAEISPEGIDFVKCATAAHFPVLLSHPEVSTSFRL